MKLQAFWCMLILRLQDSEKLKIVLSLLKKYWLLSFYIYTIVYLELIYRLWNFMSMSADFVFPIIFALYSGVVLFLFSCILKENINKIISIVITALMTIGYSLQLLYFSVFHTPMSLYSLSGADDAMQFRDVMISAITKSMVSLVLILVPLILLLVLIRRLSFLQIRPPAIYSLLILCCIFYDISILSVHLTSKKTVSQYSLYYNTSAPELSVIKLGLLTTARLDLQRLVFGFEQNDFVEEESIESISLETVVKEEIIKAETFNTMKIDFDTLIKNEKNEVILDMHKYFSTIKPTNKNEYTGMFKGDNLILITAEAFSPYAIDPELTPTLYKMSTQGFVFNNFYNPIWGVSTSDGEYVACTGLLPKPGIWSFYRSGRNSMPFVMGNQFKKLGYTTKAYHDHSYTYYKREISHPNMGYDYKAVGNGLKINKTWPESDLEMIEVTAGEYIGEQPFHTYYMTVSGHMMYNFDGNYMAKKNKALVEKLTYSDESRAYTACNLELEFAMKALIDKLEAAGIADKTVIAISPDHYPYGLSRDAIDELAGHKVEENFELYKSAFILWKKGMEPVVIEKTCSSLDINPTLSNLFGLEYDSRLLMGSDIMSNASPLVIFSNNSWITDMAKYNSLTNTAINTAGKDIDADYVNQTNKTVAKKLRYSAKILETDYYDNIIPK